MYPWLDWLEYMSILIDMRIFNSLSEMSKALLASDRLSSQSMCSLTMGHTLKIDVVLNLWFLRSNLYRSNRFPVRFSHAALWIIWASYDCQVRLHGEGLVVAIWSLILVFAT